MLFSLHLLPIVAMSVSAVVIPSPPGEYDVFYSTAKMVEKTRVDPFDPKHGPRAVMTSIFAPTNCKVGLKKIDYLPPATGTYYSELYSAYGLPNGTLQSISFQACPEPPKEHQLQFPVVLFSPALGTTRLFYNAIAQAVASAGYIVVSIDHPYDTEFLEFPDGSVVTAANITDDQVPLDVETRAKDVSFVLDQLSTKAGVAALLPGTGAAGLRTRRVAMYGHSVGGAAAAEAMHLDRRIIAGANLDGSLFGSVVQHGLHGPFLLFGHENKTQATDPTWAEFWSNLRGWRLELELAKAQHYTFSDLPFLLKLLGLPVEKVPAIQAMVGTLDGFKAFEIVHRTVVAFLGFGLRQASPSPLQEVISQYSEVSVFARGK
ncbi:Platelet-activating factor acetylhydrolase [Penicillium samsonianum]|uniref:Platelet-activating factor acetylhydrolase n=1 Tax=Penicillium samsonianum TaxID=1882272 RepID=UPI002547659B|nr:Platelet-activating factor acetylhydrolase [Penicillium samsonianum]KAJ6128119.1 Platelet-activating factor acetylhydrolase [Penicillium samsonianum]